ncbi:MAG: AMP phosphorylase [Candidatus Thermoplasmatota archaeon]|nr:AMP phosphorylase [Candidatus Thermoplasmatota archaeon]MBS3789311.1 AMP phosphorylase [Candidatus Thermoplasmatota archaeon]
MMELKAKKIDIEARDQLVILNSADAEDIGLRSQDRVNVNHGENTCTTIVETSKSLVEKGDIGLVENVMEFLEVEEGSIVTIKPTGKPESVEHIKEKLDGQELSEHGIREIIQDIVNKRLSDIELSAYVSGIYSQGMNNREIKYLINAMIETGDTIEYDRHPVFDHHSIGGVPGNKITLLIVPIVASAGLMIPKTSSRAISSAGGTADIFETLAEVDLSIGEIKEIAEDVGGTIAWGGAVNLAPSDDMIIRAEYPLRIDPYPQVLASVLSKKKSAGAEYLVMDIPVGANTKVENIELGRKYARDFVSLSEDIGIETSCALSYGGQPIGNTIGPAIEAKEALMALEGKEVPSSLIEKSTTLAGMVLEKGGIRDGKEEAKKLLESGEALEKMKQIIERQRGDPEISSEDIEIGKHSKKIYSDEEGYVDSINNDEIIKIVRAAGGPNSKKAGIMLNKKKGDKVEIDEQKYTIYSEYKSKLKEAIDLANHLKPLKVEGMILETHPDIKNI